MVFFADFLHISVTEESEAEMGGGGRGRAAPQLRVNEPKKSVAFLLLLQFSPLPSPCQLKQQK
jgi:hypothetical protein